MSTMFVIYRRDTGEVGDLALSTALVDGYRRDLQAFPDPDWTETQAIPDDAVAVQRFRDRTHHYLVNNPDDPTALAEIVIATPSIVPIHQEGGDEADLKDSLHWISGNGGYVPADGATIQQLAVLGLHATPAGLTVQVADATIGVDPTVAPLTRGQTVAGYYHWPDAIVDELRTVGTDFDTPPGVGGASGRVSTVERNLRPGTVSLKKAADDSPLTDGVHYRVDSHRLGLVTILDAGAVPDATQLKISYTADPTLLFSLNVKGADHRHRVEVAADLYHHAARLAFVATSDGQKVQHFVGGGGPGNPLPPPLKIGF